MINNPVDTGRELNVHKTFRRYRGCLLYVLYTFNIRPVSNGKRKKDNGIQWEIAENEEIKYLF